MYRPIIAIALLGVALSAQGGVYKCDIDGRTHYQETPCPASGESTRVPVIKAPESSRGGGLRAAEVQALRELLLEKAAGLPGNGLDEDDAAFIASIYRLLELRRASQ